MLLSILHFKNVFMLTVLGLGIALAVVCLAICMYVTSRIGGKMWSGAIPSDHGGPCYSYYVSNNLIYKHRLNTGDL